ncbi:MAG: hypothetical protein Kow0060_12190 [Methylohalobius crimeensis]
MDDDGSVPGQFLAAFGEVVERDIETFPDVLLLPFRVLADILRIPLKMTAYSGERDR